MLCPSSIRRRNSNPWHLEHESPPSPLDQVNFVSRSLYCKQIIAQSVYFTVLILLIQKCQIVNILTKWSHAPVAAAGVVQIFLQFKCLPRRRRPSHGAPCPSTKEYLHQKIIISISRLLSLVCHNINSAVMDEIWKNSFCVVRLKLNLKCRVLSWKRFQLKYFTALATCLD